MSRAFLHHAWELALALLAFALGTALVRACLPPDHDGQLGAKLAHFAAHAHEYDAVFIGSSRVLRGIDTEVLERELDRAGVELRSYNFGVGGMRTFEQDYLLHRLLAMEPRRLAWIFMEAGPVGMTLPEHHEFIIAPELFSARHVQWHTLRETRRLLAAIRRIPVSPWRKLVLARTHLGLLARNWSNLGALAGRLFASAAERELRAREEAPLQPRAGPGAAVPGPGAGPAQDPAPARPGLLDSAPQRAMVARISAQNALPVALDEIDLGFHRQQLEQAAARGVELVYFTMPGAEGSPEALRLHELGLLPTLFHFNHPERHPELFRVEHRFDLGHLNALGAEHLSRSFAGAFLEHLRTTASGH